jgi:hypothetical protein
LELGDQEHRSERDGCGEVRYGYVDLVVDNPEEASRVKQTMKE